MEPEPVPEPDMVEGGVQLRKKNAYVGHTMTESREVVGGEEEARLWAAAVRFITTGRAGSESVRRAGWISVCTALVARARRAITSRRER